MIRQRNPIPVSNSMSTSGDRDAENDDDYLFFDKSEGDEQAQRLVSHGPALIRRDEIEFEQSDLIGKGSFGHVFRGTCRSNTVAVKVCGGFDTFELGLCLVSFVLLFLFVRAQLMRGANAGSEEANDYRQRA